MFVRKWYPAKPSRRHGRCLARGGEKATHGTRRIEMDQKGKSGQTLSIERQAVLRNAPTSSGNTQSRSHLLLRWLVQASRPPKNQKNKNTEKTPGKRERKRIHSMYQHGMAVSTSVDAIHNLASFRTLVPRLGSSRERHESPRSLNRLNPCFRRTFAVHSRHLPVDTTYRSSCDPRRTAGIQDKRRLERQSIRW